MKKLRFIIAIAAILLAAVACSESGCSLDEIGTTPIADIIDRPQDYAGRTVKVKGTVSFPISLFGKGRFQLTDNSGESITVVARKGYMVPDEGVTVKVKGKVEQSYRFGDISKIILKITDYE